MPGDAADILLALGRVLLGGLFVVGGIRHFFIVDIITPMIAGRGLPMPKLVLYVGSIFQIVAGLLLMLGLWVAPAAFGLIVFTVTASVMLVNFWDMEGPARQSALSTCLSNGAIVGGLLIAAATAL
ncbi:MAG: DoxX family protein [Pseudolabrys sp.]|nr:DoxX family protein [Pseudolabrys sp.]